MTHDSKNELYFCLKLTENEHWLFENDLKQKCQEFNLELKYYRKLKDGHVPLYREIKIIGENIGKMKGFLKNKKMLEFVEANPHRIKNEQTNQKI